MAIADDLVGHAHIAYLGDPFEQYCGLNGKPLIGGWIEVYQAGTDTRYITMQNFDGAMNPFKIPLNADGRVVMLADPSLTYDMYVRNSYGDLVCSRLNVECTCPGNISIKGADTRINNTDGTLDISLRTLGNNVREYTVNTHNKVLDVQEPLYFVENSNTATVIGFSGDNYATKYYVDSAVSGKQDKLPTVVNDRYLHTNKETGALEWSEVQGGGSTYTAGDGIDISDDVISVDDTIQRKVDTSLETEATTVVGAINEIRTALVQEGQTRAATDESLQEDLDTKVDKVPAQAGNPFVYGRMNIEAGGTEGKFTMCSTSPLASTVAQRNNKGQLFVAEPEAGLHAATKKYVDDGDATASTKVKQEPTSVDQELAVILKGNNRSETSTAQEYFNTSIHANPAKGDFAATTFTEGGTKLEDKYASKTDLTAETTARTNADNALNTAIGDVSQSLQSEIGTRTTADTQLQRNIDTEAAARLSNMQLLSEWLDEEVSDREAADTALSTRINNKQDKLPNYEDEKYLHVTTNEQSKLVLEWAEVQQGIPGTVIATEKDGTTPVEGQKIVHLTQAEYNQLAANGQLDEDTYYNTDGDGPEAFVNWGAGIAGNIENQSDLMNIVPKVNVSETPTATLENVKVNETVYGLLGNRTVGNKDDSIQTATVSNPYIAPSDGYVILTSTTGNKTYLSFGNSALHYSMAEATGSERVVVFAVKGMSMYLSRTGTNTTFVPVVYYNP